ncbi:hypothetical protein HXX25_06390 [Hyphobacterium sp. CCMP332]|uniref:hypothetical protein n=1 Tax=Hyphobacterium sp. CCMP332 TaxID=2749086 RepID=UPI0016509F34|nr:hypothetical protein [Hyphobacterium sp. CCMP332]QNL18997.1 hypothetical protein HXX25_06390 [Hyphobacterium sp. CCMP332]
MTQLLQSAAQLLQAGAADAERLLAQRLAQDPGDVEAFICARSRWGEWGASMTAARPLLRW